MAAVLKLKKTWWIFWNKTFKHIDINMLSLVLSMGSLYELRMLVTFCLTAKCKLKLKLKWKEFICHLVEQIQMQNILLNSYNYMNNTKLEKISYSTKYLLGMSVGLESPNICQQSVGQIQNPRGTWKAEMLRIESTFQSCF